MPSTAIIIGLPTTCRRLEQQLDLVPQRPMTLGWVVPEEHIPKDDEKGSPWGNMPLLGELKDLEVIVARRQPGMALISLPAMMEPLIRSIRTRLRRMGVPDRFMPTMEDQLAGVGPRTHLDIDLAQLLNRTPHPIDEEAVSRLIERRRVLITGAGGSIGSELSRIVARYQPQQLILMERAEPALFEIDRQIARMAPDLPRRALLHDVVDAAGTLKHCQALEPQVIFHSAAHKHVPMMENHPSAAVDNNLFGTVAIADAARAVKTERFVMISTDKAVKPSSIMGATKRLAEQYVQFMNQESQTAYSLVRFGNVIGSSGSVLETWSQDIARGGPITVTDPRMTRYFMTIPEAAALVIESACLVDPGTVSGEVFVLDMGEPIRIVDLARRFIRQHGYAPVLPGETVTTDDVVIHVVYTGARPGEKLFEELSFDAEVMQRTRYRGINIWVLPPPHDEKIEQILTQLAPQQRPSEPETLIDLIRQLVPEMVKPVAA